MRVLDIFSGIGGFSLGLGREGMRTVAFCEMDPFCQRVLEKNFKDWAGDPLPVFSDVRRLKYRVKENGLHVLEEGAHRLELNRPIDVICGGFPCQGISTTGEGGGLEDERSGLWSEYKRLIREIKPRWAIIENVANLRAKGFVTVLQDLWSVGYDCVWNIIPASGFGAPHRRERLWIIAYPEGKGLQGCGVGERFKESHAERFLGVLAKGGSGETYWGKTEPPFFGVDDGIPSRVDRIRALGNAVVPQVVEMIGRAIMEAENEMV